jgi:PLD-like domain
VELFIDIARIGQGMIPEAHLANEAKRFTSLNWPFGSPYPRIYFDNRALDPTTYTRMPAKCVVVDARDSLIGSANFTDRGPRRNIELGALIEDEAFPKRVIAQSHALMTSDACGQLRLCLFLPDRSATEPSPIRLGIETIGDESTYGR